MAFQVDYYYPPEITRGSSSYLSNGPEPIHGDTVSPLSQSKFGHSHGQLGVHDGILKGRQFQHLHQSGMNGRSRREEFETRERLMSSPAAGMTMCEGMLDNEKIQDVEISSMSISSVSSVSDGSTKDNNRIPPQNQNGTPGRPNRRTRRKSPTLIIKLKKHRRQKANDRERHRMHLLNDALERLRLVLPSMPQDQRLTKIETLRFAHNYIWALSQAVGVIHSLENPSFLHQGGSGGCSGGSTVTNDQLQQHLRRQQEQGGYAAGQHFEIEIEDGNYVVRVGNVRIVLDKEGHLVETVATRPSTPTPDTCDHPTDHRHNHPHSHPQRHRHHNQGDMDPDLDLDLDLDEDPNLRGTMGTLPLTGLMTPEIHIQQLHLQQQPQIHPHHQHHHQQSNRLRHNHSQQHHHRLSHHDDMATCGRAADQHVPGVAPYTRQHYVPGNDTDGSNYSFNSSFEDESIDGNANSYFNY